jgi:hypothetical protein
MRDTGIEMLTSNAGVKAQVCLEAEDGMEVDGKYWGQREGRDAMKKF